MRSFPWLAAVASLTVGFPLLAQQPIDSAYTAKIRELTPTDPRWQFTTELVDYLPASSKVPSPLKVLGYVPGTIGKLSYVADVNRYFRAVAAASPRVKIFSLGMSDEGREMIIAAIADEKTIERLADYKGMAAKLADPRGLAAAERARLIKEAKPIYWLTGSIHSPETGSPEMLMELVYRLAVDESETIKSIRANVITLITPVLEVDGRDRVIDVYKESKSLNLGPQGINLVYWGKYTAHDNNRDGMVLSQKLTQNYIKGFFDWHPTFGHDLHESVPFLYTSTGTGPYNDEFDPIVVDEWHQLAYEEITELTRRGLPGVWTHGFYDGWAPNYVLAITNLHNGVGRFYETYTSRGAECHTVNLPASATERVWYRPNPPVNGVKWCIRSNINYQQSGVLIALGHVGAHRETYLENFVSKGERMIRRGQTTAPYAFVVPRGQRRAAEAAALVNLFRAHGTEVHQASSDFTLAKKGKDGDQLTVRAGDWIVRMDQPYTATTRTLLAIQKYKPDDPQPYDDTGWTLDALRHVETVAVTDSGVFAKPMTKLSADAHVEGTVAGTGSTYVVPHLGDWRSAVLPWKAGGGGVSVADAEFEANGVKYPAGTFILTDVKAGTLDAVKSLGLTATGLATAPGVARHAVALPRIALMHSWRETQNEGWVRYALDQLAVPYTYISDQSIKKPAALDRFDVVVFPHVGSQTTTLLNGAPMLGPPIPWKKTELTPNLGKWDESDDIRPGMGLDGAAALRRFVERGGLLLVEGATDQLPLTLGFSPTVTLTPAKSLRSPGNVVRAQTVAKTSPILYGYE
ncbi:MAG: M14 family zinc carboxypeptidase, partial [Gemmatimonadota bacterium]